MSRPLERRALVIASLTLWMGVAATVACRGTPQASGKGSSLELASSGFSHGEIASQFTCNGADRSPPLSWRSPPPGTRTFALVVLDRDAESFVHWVIYDLPADARELTEGLPQQAQLPDGARQGRNDFGKIGYGGPCPPGQSPHHYHFTLYALDAKLDVAPGATEAQVMGALQPHILAQDEIVEKYQR